MKDKVDMVKHHLTEIMSNSTDPVLLWSGGKDSTFLLHLLKELGYNVPVLVFPHLWSEYQQVFIKKIVKNLKLTAFYYSPNRINFDPPHVASFYNIFNTEIPVVADHIDDPSRCGLEVGKKVNFRAPKPAFHWDKAIVGSKNVDTHALVARIDFNTMPIECPLWDWTDQEVIDTTKLLGFSYDERVYDNSDEKADTGTFVACMGCVGTEKVFCPKEGKIIEGIYG